MKRISICIVIVATLLSSCGTYTSTGAYTGGQFGHILGSAVGGIAGGWHGRDIGSIVGTVGGAAAGAAIGAAADNARQKKFDSYAQQQQQHYNNAAPGYGHDVLTVRHARIKDQNHDGILSRGEQMQLEFEIVNNSNHTVYDILPVVENASRNRHVVVSQNLRIDKIGPRQLVRYTANIAADRSLRDGEVIISIGVAQGSKKNVSQVADIRVPTRRR